MAGLVKQFASGVYNLLLGMFTTGKHLGRHAITVQYPKERWTMPERSRGMVVLLSDEETGELNCTACLLCMKSCPTAAIDIDFYKDEKNKRHLKGFTVDYNVCCFCGMCEEACNFAAIKLANKYEFPEYDKGKLVWDINKLAEEGRGVPYEKPERKRPAAKKAAAAKAAAKKEEADKPKPKLESKPDDKAEAGEKPKTEAGTDVKEEKKDQPKAEAEPKAEDEKKPVVEKPSEPDNEEKKKEGQGPPAGEEKGEEKPGQEEDKG